MRLLPKNAVYDISSRIDLEGMDILNLPEQMMRQIRGRRLGALFFKNR